MSKSLLQSLATLHETQTVIAQASLGGNQTSVKREVVRKEKKGEK